MGEKMRVLVTAKTYPLPSKKYMELVCTGGVREDGSFIRLYPVDFRYRPYQEQYRKYQWIEVHAERNETDPRPETYRPIRGSHIRVLGEPIPTTHNWAERKKYVLAKSVPTMCWLKAQSQTDISFSIVKPHSVKDVVVKQGKRDWSPAVLAHFQQEYLFGPARKPLDRIPFKFSFRFKCLEPGCKGHTMMTADWEVGRLYLRMRDAGRSESEAVAAVRDKCLNDICAPDRDTYFFVGTVLKYNSWIVVGTFYPKLEPQGDFFQ